MNAIYFTFPSTHSYRRGYRSATTHQTLATRPPAPHQPLTNPSPNAHGERFDPPLVFHNLLCHQALTTIRPEKPHLEVSAHQTRSARTLIEVVVIISLLSVVMGLSVTSLGTLFRVRQQVQRDSEQGAAINRLATRLRSDAHEALSASAKDGFQLALADGREIHYSFVAPSIIRQVRRDTTVLHHDTFRLSRSVNVTFEEVESTSKRLIRLSIRPAESRLPPRDIPRTATIEAAVGLTASMAQIARSP
jgi:hypothetical protein